VKKLLFTFAIGCSFCALAAFADPMTGYISDSHCGAKHDSVSAANTKCIEGCMKHGSDPVLVSDGKVSKLDAESAEKAKAFAGKKVTVDGTMEGDTLKINTIQEAPAGQ
jgi:hypothetical protein